MKSAKTETIVSFLKSKGWTIANADERVIYMKPAPDIKTDNDTYLHIPLAKFEGTPSYNEVTALVTYTIAGIYELDVQDLESLFSKNLEEIKQSVAQQQAMLAAAS